MESKGVRLMDCQGHGMQMKQKEEVVMCHWVYVFEGHILPPPTSAFALLPCSQEVSSVFCFGLPSIITGLKAMESAAYRLHLQKAGAQTNPSPLSYFFINLS